MIQCVCPECDSLLAIHADRPHNLICDQCNSLLLYQAKELRFIPPERRSNSVPRTFCGIKVNEDMEILGVKRNPVDTASNSECIECSNEVSPLNSHKCSKVVGSFPKLIPHPTLKESNGEPVMIRIFVPKLQDGRICLSCVETLTSSSYINREGKAISQWLTPDGKPVTIKFENEPNDTVKGSSDRKVDRPNHETEVREVRISKDETVFIKVAPRPEKVDDKSFAKFGFKAPKDYRKYLR